MQKDQLKKYLKNQLLIGMIRHKKEIDDTRKRLSDMLIMANETDFSDAFINEIQDKCEEYAKAGQKYGFLIEDVWGITWQNEAIIKRYIDCTDDEFDKLPNEIKKF